MLLCKALGLVDQGVHKEVPAAEGDDADAEASEQAGVVPEDAMPPSCGLLERTEGLREHCSASRNRADSAARQGQSCQQRRQNLQK